MSLMSEYTSLAPQPAKLARIVLAAILAGAPALATAAPHLATLYTFTGGGDGASPEPSVIAGPEGALIGATTGIGNGTSGTIYELLPPAAGGTAWRFQTLYTFTGGADGAEPGNLVADKHGNLYGETSYGGNSTCSGGCGTVFELSPPAAGGTSWTEHTLYSFTGGADGFDPTYGLSIDRSGRLVGFAQTGGLCYLCGTIFQLTPPTDARPGWSEATLYQFAGASGGAVPTGVPLLGADGSIFGVTGLGGNVTSTLCTTNTAGCGTAFQLSPPDEKLGKWTMTQLRVFDGQDASYPSSGLVADRFGNLFGTSLQGGDLTACTDPGYPPGCGTVFELSPPSGFRRMWEHSIVWSFTAGAGGDYPYTDSLTQAQEGFITTVEGDGIATFGTIVLFTPPPHERNSPEYRSKWQARTLYTFSGGADGGFPADALLWRGNAYFGTTVEGGNQGCLAGGGCGTVFRFSP